LQPASQMRNHSAALLTVLRAPACVTAFSRFIRFALAKWLSFFP